MSDPRLRYSNSFIRSCAAQAGVNDTEMLVVEGLNYLKELDESGRLAPG